MRVRISNWMKALAVVLVWAAAAVAHASAGNGIRFGGSEGRLHPFFDFETRYDSNVSYTSADAALGDVILHFRPGAELKVPGDLAAVEFTGAVDWAQYLGVEGDTKGLSRLYGDAALAALFNRRGAVSARIDNTFQRRVSTTSLSADTTAVVSNANVLSLSLPWKPGGGALVVSANGQWLLEAFQKYKDEPRYPLSDLGYSQFRGEADVLWQFLPRTSATFQAGYFTRVPNVSQLVDPVSGTTPRLDDASGFDALAGVTGLLTPRIGATAKVGYGMTSAPTKDVGSFIGDFGLEWLPLQSISFRTGYTRSFGLDPKASVYISDGVNAGVRVKVADRFAFSGGVRYDHLTFEAFPNAETNLLRVDPTLEGAVGKWLNIGLGYVYSSRDVHQWPTDLLASGEPLPDYTKNEVFLKVGLTY